LLTEIKGFADSWGVAESTVATLSRRPTIMNFGFLQF
jgi:hypothetical protein